MGEVVCHDGTPFCDYECSRCHFIMHVHKSQLPDGWEDIELRTFCKRCGTELVLPHPVTWTGELARE